MHCLVWVSTENAPKTNSAIQFCVLHHSSNNGLYYAQMISSLRGSNFILFDFSHLNNCSDYGLFKFVLHFTDELWLLIGTYLG